MDSNDLALLLRDFRETVPVSRPAKFLPAALALRGFSKREPRQRTSVITQLDAREEPPFWGRSARNSNTVY
jgi:hypothetical protein